MNKQRTRTPGCKDSLALNPSAKIRILRIGETGGGSSARRTDFHFSPATEINTHSHSLSCQVRHSKLPLSVGDEVGVGIIIIISEN